VASTLTCSAAALAGLVGSELGPGPGAASGTCAETGCRAALRPGEGCSVGACTAVVAGADSIEGAVAAAAALVGAGGVVTELETPMGSCERALHPVRSSMTVMLRSALRTVTSLG